MLPQAIAVMQGKGGVGKTSSVAGLAGLYAKAGWRTLTVDIDPQGNLGRDLGYFEQVDEARNGGQALIDAVNRHPLEPLRDVRPGLDCVPGGDATEELIAILRHRESRDPRTALTALRDALLPIAGQYHMILIDCPPGTPILQRAALAAVGHLLIPTRADEASIDGLYKVAALYNDVRADVNPGLNLLGAFLFGIGVQSKRQEAWARAQMLACLEDEHLILQARIRHAEGAALDARRRGQLPHELEEQLPAARKERFARFLDSRKSGGKHRPEVVDPGVSASSAGLAEDYALLCGEVTARLQAHRDAAAAVAQ